MRPLYIFDLDGTLALCEHRQHLVRQKHPDWNAFFDACVDDTPNLPVVYTMHKLSLMADVEIWSGRSARVRPQTERWLRDHSVVINLETNVTRLRMRDEGDFKPDELLKYEWLMSLSDHDRRRLVAVFDDRDKVVQMWRENGVSCFQVANGGF